MALMTYFKAALPCQRCGHLGTAWVESRLGDRGATYQVGDCPGADISPSDFEDTSFRVRPPVPGDPIHVLLPWTCEKCGRGNFAEVVLADGCVRAIEAVELDSATLSRLHYIATDTEDMLQTIIGESLYDDRGVRPDWLHRLRAALAAGSRWGR
jgi:hypothetical protein